MEFGDIALAFGLTVFAGLSTGIGSALAFFAKRTNTRLVSLALGFSAGVMLYVSFIEIFYKGRESLVARLGEAGGYWTAVSAFFGGFFLSRSSIELFPHSKIPMKSIKLRRWPMPSGRPRRENSSGWVWSQRWPSQFIISPRGLPNPLGHLLDI